jgi:hypothetical protein
MTAWKKKARVKKPIDNLFGFSLAFAIYNSKGLGEEPSPLLFKCICRKSGFRKNHDEVNF